MNEDYFSSGYLAKQYDQMAQSYNDDRHLFNNKSQLIKLGELVKEGDRVLDVGCGSGIPVAKYFADLGCETIGFDLSKEMILLARENVPEGEFFQADLQVVEFPPSTFDLVVSFYCIFHIEKKRQGEVFQKFYEYLKHDKCAYFTLAGEKYTNKKEFQGTMKFGKHVLPYAHFSEEQYREMLTKTGFDILSMKDLTIGGETMLWALVRR